MLKAVTQSIILSSASMHTSCPTTFGWAFPCGSGSDLYEAFHGAIFLIYSSCLSLSLLRGSSSWLQLWLDCNADSFQGAHRLRQGQQA